MANLTTVTLTNGGGTGGSGTVSTLDNLIGTAGTSSAQVQTVQGIASMTPVQVSQATAANLNATVSGTVSINAIPAGTNVIGSVKATDGTNTAAVKAASTAAAATDPALVVTLSPNSAGILATPIQSLPTLTATANGLTSSRVNAAASTNATSLKASAGNIGRIDVFNVAAYNVFLKLYNKASAPTVGTDTPVWTIPVAAGGGFSADFPRGKSFATGIAYAITKLQADTDTTVVAAGDLTGSIDWI